MNKNEHCEGQIRRRGGCGNRSRKVRRARDMRSARTALRAPAPEVTHLSAEAERLLAVLGEPQADAFIDPIGEDAVLARRSRGGVSVGAGCFQRDAAEELVRHDLARWIRETALSLRITDAGQAYARRAAAAPGADPYLSQHRALGEAVMAGPEGPARVRVDLEESPLAWMRRRRGRDGEPLIDEACFEAGERLRRDITLAGLLPGVTARWDAPKGSGPQGPAESTDRMVAARQRIRHAFLAVGSDFGDLLVDLCGFLKGIERIEQERGWPARSAKVVIRLALARLAEHYGLGATAQGPQASRGIRTWRAVVIEGGLTKEG
jgi:hypothetical protein